MASTGSDVILRRVRLQGRASSPRRARGELLQALDDAPWPPTAAGEILQVRFIKATGTPRQIGLTVAKEVQRLADLAADGWAEGAEHAPAVRFRSQVDRMACLLRDVLADKLPHRWFWDGWRRQAPAGASAALVRVFQDEPLAAPSVVARLAEASLEARFWAVLEPADAQHLLGILGHASGWGGLIQAVLQGDSGLPPPALAIPFPVAPAPLPHDLPARDPRVVLAALLGLWQRSPGILKGSHGVEALRAAAHGLARHSAARSGAPQATPRQPPAAPGDSKGTSDLERSLGRPWTPPGRSSEPLASPPAPPAPERPAPPGLTWTESIRDLGPPEEAGAAGPPAPAAPDLLISPERGWEVCTSQGGIFYLLNALAWEGYQQRLRDWDEPGGGWRLMWRLGLALGCRPDAGLEAFLLREGALDEAALHRLPPLAAPLARLGALRYGEGVWNEGLFTLPARVLSGRSHLDVHFRLEDARVEVRRAGLDVNPGWLPWLGRVVIFHYGSGLEPERP